jgi:hypothetical protein
VEVLKMKPLNLDNRKRAAAFGILVFIILIAIFYVLNIKTAVEPPYLIQILNTLFLGLIPVAIAVIAVKTFRVSGRLSILLVSAGMLVMGVGLTAAGWVLGLAGGQNISVTLSNVSYLAVSIFLLSAAVLMMTGSEPVLPQSRSHYIFMVFG